MKNIAVCVCVLISFVRGYSQTLDSLNAFAQKPALEFQKTDSLKAIFAAKIDSLKQTVPGDNEAQVALSKVDSVQAVFYKRADSLQAVYQKPLSTIDAQSSKLQHKIDSLQNLKLPANDLTRKLDSLQRVRTQQVAKLNKELDELKSKAMKPLKEVTLPPQMQEPLNKLTGSINNYKVPDKGFAIPGLPDKTPGIPNLGKLPAEGRNMPGIGKAELPGNFQKPDIKGLTGNLDKLNEATGKLTELRQTTGQIGNYAEDAKNMAAGNFDKVKTFDKTVENQVMKLEGANDLKTGSAELDKLKNVGSALKNPDSLKMLSASMAKDQVQKIAVNHFAGQEKALQAAMSQMAKVKTKYTEVKSLAELPKHPPNPLKGKPFIERIVPGITFQIQKSTYFLLDGNVFASYRLYPHWSVGAGWNHRFAIDDWKIIQQPRIYGPRASIEFKWKKGFNLHLLPELMNTEVPQSPDPSGRAWVWSIFAGIKKDFTVYKSIKGNTELLYNVFDQKGNSPYVEKIAVRFGFEFPMKKQKK